MDCNFNFLYPRVPKHGLRQVISQRFDQIDGGAGEYRHRVFRNLGIVHALFHIIGTHRCGHVNVKSDVSGVNLRALSLKVVHPVTTDRAKSTQCYFVPLVSHYQLLSTVPITS